MDIVITYVNGRDPLWQKDYQSTFNIPIIEKRYRDWGTLKFLFRGIDTYMPFINNVFLVVSRESQVPAWVNRDTVKVVVHEDIIPSKFLPTFNSTTIELFLHNIKDLSEQFIYFNDDIFPVNPCSPEDFFVDNKVSISFSRCLFHTNMYKKQCRNSDKMALQALGKKIGIFFIRPQHICAPMLKSSNAEAFAKAKESMLPTISRLRTADNINQYFFTDYNYHCGRAVNKRIQRKFLSMAIHSPEDIAKSIINQKTKLLCINDVNITENKFDSYLTCITSAFNQRFPDRSRFEV